MFVGVETWLDDKRGGVLENCGGKNRFGGLPGRLKLSFCSELNPRPVFSVRCLVRLKTVRFKNHKNDTAIENFDPGIQLLYRKYSLARTIE